MKRIFTLLTLTLFTALGFSQETAEVKDFESKVMTTDRGAFTKPGANINKGLQVEFGTDFEWTDDDNEFIKTTTASPFTAKLRWGLSDRVEFNFAIDNKQIALRSWDGMMTDKYNYWTPLEIGLRAQFVDKKHTEMAFFFALDVITTQRSAFDDNGEVRPWVLADRPNYVTPELSLLANHNIGKRFVLGYNFGLNWTGVQLDDELSSQNPDIFYSIRALVHACKRMDVYVEHYNKMRKVYYSDLGLNAGIRYAVLDKLVLDLNGGLGLNSASPEGFIGFGASYKMGK